MTNIVTKINAPREFYTNIGLLAMAGRLIKKYEITPTIKYTGEDNCIEAIMTGDKQGYYFTYTSQIITQQTKLTDMRCITPEFETRLLTGKLTTKEMSEYLQTKKTTPLTESVSMAKGNKLITFSYDFKNKETRMSWAIDNGTRPSGEYFDKWDINTGDVDATRMPLANIEQKVENMLA